MADCTGVWGEIEFRQEPTAGIVGRAIRSLMQLINGDQYQTSRMGEAIDFVVCHGPYLYTLESGRSVSRGLFPFDGEGLTLCLADAAAKERPTRFILTETPYESVAVYRREIVV